MSRPTVRPTSLAARNSTSAGADRSRPARAGIVLALTAGTTLALSACGSTTEAVSPSPSTPTPSTTVTTTPTATTTTTSTPTSPTTSSTVPGTPTDTATVTTGSATPTPSVTTVTVTATPTTSGAGTGSASPSAPVSKVVGNRYPNTLFGYTGLVPTTFTATEYFAEGNGVILTSGDKQLMLTYVGANNPSKRTPTQVAADRVADQTAEGNRFTSTVKGNLVSLKGTTRDKKNVFAGVSVGTGNQQGWTLFCNASVPLSRCEANAKVIAGRWKAGDLSVPRQLG